MNITPTIVAAQLALKVEDVVRWLLPKGERIGQDWCVGGISGEPGKSLKVCLQGEKLGRWADFAEGNTAGDLLDLIAATQQIPLGRAIREACTFLGIERQEWGSRKQTYAEPERPKNAQAISKAPAVATWLASRKITPETAARYKLVADGDGVIVYPYIRDGKLLHLKFRTVREKKFWASAGTEPCLFGWQGLAPGARAVILVEGEQDCLAMAEYGLQALSIPFGAGKGAKHQWIENEWENLERFDTIFLATDMDGPGMETTQELAERLGRHRVRAVKLPRKDANDCLMQNVDRTEIVQAVKAAKTLDPIELRNALDFLDEVIDRFHPKEIGKQGFLMPWHELHDRFIFGWGETTILAGYSAHGKSEICGQLILDAIRQGHLCCVGSFEFKPSKWIQRQVRQSLSNIQPTKEDITRAMHWISKGLWAIDLYGKNKLDRLLDIFTYANRRYGVRIFCIDNLSKLGIADDDIAAQKAAIEAITEWAVQHNTHLILVHHLRKEESDYSATGQSKLSLKGSSAIGDLPDNIWLVWRNKTKERAMKDPRFNTLPPDEQQDIRSKPDTILTCEKFRMGDEEPKLPLWFDLRSHLWQDTPTAPVVRYVKDVKIG